MTPTETRRAYLGSFAALALTAGPVLAYVLLIGHLGLSSTVQILSIFLLLGIATKGYLVLSERFTRPKSLQLSGKIDYKSYPAHQPAPAAPPAAAVEQTLPGQQAHL